MNVTNFQQQNTSKRDSLYKIDRTLDAWDDDLLSVGSLSMGSLCEDHDWYSDFVEPEDVQEHVKRLLNMSYYCRQSEDEDEDLCDEDMQKVERWTRIRNDGFEVIDGVKYTETGTVIYSGYDHDEDEEERRSARDGTPSEILAKTRGNVLRAQARQKIQDNHDAYKGQRTTTDRRRPYRPRF